MKKSVVFNNQFAPKLGGQFELESGGQFAPELVVNLHWKVVVNLTGFSNSSQLLISRKFSKSFSLELAPIYVHKNLYDLIPGTEKKDQFVLGAGGRYKLTKRLSLNLEYAARIDAPENTLYHNPLSLGLDIETGGHVFQLVFSNSQPLNDVAVFTNATGKWNGGGIYFGFNMYRVF